MRVLTIEKVDLRQIDCIVCHTKKFATMGHVVQHVESGRCVGCSGKDNARKMIHQYIRNSNQGQLLVGYDPQNSDSDSDSDEPSYKCSSCGKVFRLLSSMLEHQRALSH